MPNHLIAGRNAFQNLRDIFAQLAQLAAAIGACLLRGQVGVHFAGKIRRQWTPSWLLPGRRVRVGCRRNAFSLTGLEFFELQLQLFDLAGDLLTLRAENHPPQLGDDQLEMFYLVIAADHLFVMGSNGLILSEHLLLLRNNQRFEKTSIECAQIAGDDGGIGHRREYAIGSSE